MDFRFIKETAIFIIAGLCLSFSSVFAQWQWAIRGGGGYCDYNDPSWVCTDKEGNAIFAGAFVNQGGDIDGQTTSRLPSSNYCGVVMKYAPDGTKKWLKYFSDDGTAAEWGVQVRGAAIDADNNIYITGSFAYTVIVDNDTLAANDCGVNGYSNIFLCKFSPEGTVLWLRDIGATDNDVFTFFQAPIRVTPSGQVLILGEFYTSITAGGTTITTNSNTDIFLASYTRDGDFRWIKKFGSGAEDQPITFDVDTESNIYLTAKYYNATSTDFGGIHISSPPQDSLVTKIFMAKLDTAGKPLWVRSESILPYVKTFPGGVINYGGFDSSLIFADAQFKPEDGSLAIVRYSSDGLFRSIKTFGGNSQDYATSLAVAPNGDLYCAFMTWGPLTIAGDQYGPPDQYLYSFLVHFDPIGNILQYSKLPPLVRPLYTALNPSGSAMLVAGQFDSTTMLVPGKTLRSIKNCNDFFFGEFSFPASSSVAPDFAQQNLNIYPDPANSIVTISLPDDWQVSDAFITLTNCLGAEVRKITLSDATGNTKNLRIDVSGLTSGMYNYSLRNAQHAASGSFIIEH